VLIGEKNEVLARFPVAELVEKVKAAEGVKAIVFDGIVTGRLVDAANEKGVKVVIGDRVSEGVRIPQGIEIRAFKDL
jgi:phage terminase large subunit-like protein